MIVSLNESWDARSPKWHGKEACAKPCIWRRLALVAHRKQNSPFEQNGWLFRLTPICFLDVDDVHSVFRIRKVPKEEHLECSTAGFSTQRADSA